MVSCHHQIFSIIFYAGYYSSLIILYLRSCQNVFLQSEKSNVSTSLSHFTLVVIVTQKNY